MRGLPAIVLTLVLCPFAPGEEAPDVPIDVAKLVVRLTDEKREVRFNAARELGERGHRASVDPLLKSMRQDRDRYVRRAAARALGRIGDGKAVPALIDAILDRDPFVAKAAHRSLRTLTGMRLDFPAKASIEDREALRKTWRKRWANRPKPTDPVTLVERLSARAVNVRFAAAVELGHRRYVRAVRALCRTLAEDEDLFVRRACARSLGHIGSRAAVPALIDAMADEEMFVAISAAEAFRKLTQRDPGFRAVRGATGRIETLDASLAERRRLRDRHREWWKTAAKDG